MLSFYWIIVIRLDFHKVNNSLADLSSEADD